jgi:hypothetical protein
MDNVDTVDEEQINDLISDTIDSPIINNLSEIITEKKDGDEESVSINKELLKKSIEESRIKTLNKLNLVETNILNLSNPTSLCESMTRVETLIKVIELKEKFQEGPSMPSVKIYNLLPKCMIDIDIIKEGVLIENRKSMLSSTQRNIICGLLYLKQKYDYTAVLRAATKTNKSQLVKKWWE